MRFRSPSFMSGEINVPVMKLDGRQVQYLDSCGYGTSRADTSVFRTHALNTMTHAVSRTVSHLSGRPDQRDTRRKSGGWWCVSDRQNERYIYLLNGILSNLNIPISFLLPDLSDDILESATSILSCFLQFKNLNVLFSLWGSFMIYFGRKFHINSVDFFNICSVKCNF